jgi:hypothetical protein
MLDLVLGTLFLKRHQTAANWDESYWPADAGVNTGLRITKVFFI